MKSNVCKIEKGNKDLEAIFNECERVALYNELEHKQALQLRLLCEELDGMLPEIVGDFDGILWFEFDGKQCLIKTSIDIAEISQQSKEELISVAKNNKNASAKGIVGKIRSAIENFFLDEDFCDAVVMSSSDLHMANGYCNIIDYSYYWSLDQYRSNTKKEEKSEEWDELEKSITARLADEIKIFIRGNTVEMVIEKTF